MPEQNSRPFRVFLSYASEDMEKASELCQKLTGEGMDVWWDQEKLLPGQDWKLEIAEGIDHSDAILVCLSNLSVRKEGYVQKEMKDALERAQEKPEGMIFVIPVRWDYCKVPRSLAGIQYVDMFETGGYEKLLKALEIRAKEVGSSFAGQKALRTPEPDNAYELHNLVRNMLRDEVGLQESLRHLMNREPDDQGWFHRQVRSELQTIMGDQNQPVKERARAGEVLSMLGDPRFRADAWSLPDDDLLGFVEIPSGTFLMGEDTPGKQKENGQHPLHLPTFHISRYPVTVAQYLSFLADTNSQNQSISAEPGIQNQPVTSVSWHEARQYCLWLTDKLRRWTGTPGRIAHLLKENSCEVTLPSEAEWEKAARGMADARKYPWGTIADPNRANYSAAALQRPSAVGCFEGGRSPFGISDMAGNVYEWTRSNWGSNIERPQFLYPYQQDARENIQASDKVFRVCRGGSCYSPQEHLQCSHRSAEAPNHRREHIGFRLAVTRLSTS